MKILITAGGTIEKIDEIRTMSNISTGKLGCSIAERLLIENEVHYIHSKTTVKPKNISLGATTYECNSANEVYNKMKELVPKMDVVIHAMAISDFSFNHQKVKLKSNAPEAFIEYLKNNITVNPKILKKIKQWNEKVKLFSFKFEVGLDNKSLIEVATKSMNDCNGDYVLANDKTEMQKHNSHIGYLISKDGTIEKCSNKFNIMELIVSKLSKQKRV